MSNFTSTVPALPAGHVPTAAEVVLWYNLLTAESDTWTDYSASVAWTASTTNPVLGNGTITAHYKQIGKTVYYAGTILMGSTTTYGSGLWIVNLPVTALSTSLGVGSTVLGAAGSRYGGSTRLRSTSSMDFTSPSGGSVTSAVPAAWASGNQFSWSVTYEAA